MAAAIASRATLPLTIDSAGLSAHGDAAQANAIEVAREHDLDLQGHQPKQLTERLVQEAGLVLVMESAMVPKVKRIATGANVQTLGEHVSDPFGLGIDAYRETWDQLARLIPPLLEKSLS